MEKASELRRPVEDMLLKDQDEMPQIPRIKGVLLSGQPLADLLMVVEFLNNFQEPLDLGMFLDGNLERVEQSFWMLWGRKCSKAAVYCDLFKETS